MKKILLLLLVFSSILASGQTEKGSFMIGGNASVNFTKNSVEDNMSEGKNFSFELNPLAGYFVANKFSVGLSIPFSWSRQKAKYEGFNAEYKSLNRGSGISPFVRYYIPVKSFFIVTEAAYSWSYNKYTYDSIDPVTGEIIGNDEFSSKSKSIRLSAGPTFFLSKYSSIEILANYQHDTFDQESSQTYRASNFYVSVGFQIYLPKSKE